MTTSWRLAVGALPLVFLVAGCTGGVLEPHPLVVGTEACGFCRMTVSQNEFAAQVVVAGELPRFFDDLGCLAGYLAATDPPDDVVAIFVMDRASRSWVPAGSAVFGRVESLATPMGSHLVAHASLSGKDADSDMTGWVAASLDDVVPTRWQALIRSDGRSQ